jgi:probable F420-dependent oxidoreductase
LLSHTESLAIATGIANIWARDAVAMASASRTVAEISDGRFILGIGVSHKPVIANRGHTYDKPYSYMKQYLPQLKDALKGPGQTQRKIPLLIAALHPKMLELAATQTDGTHPYFVPPEHTAKVRAQIGTAPLDLRRAGRDHGSRRNQGSRGSAPTHELLCDAPAELQKQFESPRMAG